MTGCCLPPSAPPPGRPVLDVLDFTAGPSEPGALVLADGSRWCARCRREIVARAACDACRPRLDKAPCHVRADR